MTEIICVGEAMLELSRRPDGETRLAHGGDTLNTATYLARMGQHPSFFTALGHDPFSDELIEAWQGEGIDTSFVLRHPTRLPGLYAIRTDAEGERSFYYWRENSAARALFDIEGHEGALTRAETARWLYLSGITLSLFDATGRERLARLAGRIRANGGEVVFDPNYRPRGWASREAAQAAIEEFGRTVTLALPTYEDEAALFGDADADATARRWRGWGCPKVVVKEGPDGCRLYGESAEASHVPVPEAVKPRDTTGAGDSFNGGFLARLMEGQSMADAALAGHRLAGTVIQYPGAIIPRDAMPQ